MNMNWGALIIGMIMLAVLRAHPDTKLGKAILFLGVLFVAANIAAWFFLRQHAGTLIEVLTFQATQGYVRAGALSVGYAFVASGRISIIWGSVAHLRAQPSAQADGPASGGPAA